MNVLIGAIIFTISLLLFRFTFSRTGIIEKFWNMVGNKVHLKDFSKVWIGMLFVVSIGFQIILKPITSYTTFIEIVYAIAFSACFSLMPGKINGIDRAIK